jgi:hypothetical protein
MWNRFLLILTWFLSQLSIPFWAQGALKGAWAGPGSPEITPGGSFGSVRADNCAFDDGKTAFSKNRYKKSADFGSNETSQTWGSRLHESAIFNVRPMKMQQFLKTSKMAFGGCHAGESFIFHVFLKESWKTHMIARCRFLKDVLANPVFFQKTLLTKKHQLSDQKRTQQVTKMTYLFMSFLIRFLGSTFVKARSFFEGYLKPNRYFQNANFEFSCQKWCQNGSHNG